MRFHPVLRLSLGHVFEIKLSLQMHHVYSTLKRRGNGRFQVVSTWNTRGVFLGIVVSYYEQQQQY